MPNALFPNKTVAALCAGLLLSAAPLYAQFFGPNPVYQEPNIDAGYTASVDLDRDGDVDILLSWDTKAAWMRNDGTGHFSDPIVVFDVPGETVSRIYPAGDLNDDQEQDILIQTHTGTGLQTVYTLALLLNDGSENFGQYTVVWSIGPNATSGGLNYFYTADIDLDGRLDLLMHTDALGPYYLYWRRNTGQGTYATGGLVTQTYLTANAVDDMDGDGDPDVAAFYLQNPSGINGFWLENQGNGNFQSPEESHEIPLALQFPVGLKTFDADNDGDRDVLACEQEKIHLAINNGSGDFDTTFVLTTSLGTNFINTAIPADVDKDGWTDILFVDGGYCGWFRNEGGGTFTLQPPGYPDLQFNLDRAFGPQVADINGDGANDLLLCGHDGAGVILNEGTGYFHQSKRIIPRFGSFYAAKAVDTDQDGDQDVFALSAYEVSFLKNEGAEKFAPPVTAERQIGPVFDFELLDLSGDQKPDIVTLEGETAWFPNIDGATFGERQLVNSNGKFHLFDVDSDGDPDLFGNSDLGSDTAATRWYENNGAGHFTDRGLPPIDSIDQLQYYAFADLDTNGLPDIVVFNHWYEQIVRYRNLGNGQFGPRELLLTNEHAGGYLFLTDLNNDLHPDFLRVGDMEVAWYPGTVQGGFDAKNVLYTTPLANYINGKPGIADLDHDGDPDILLPRQFPNGTRVTWLENNGTGAFTPHHNPVDLNNTGVLNLADLDQDGFPDILAATGNPNNWGPLPRGVVWFKNFTTAPFVSGYCFWDADENKQLDSAEALLRNIRLRLEPDAPSVFSEEDGRFRFYAEPGDYTLTYQANDCWVLTTDSTAYHFQFADSLVTDLTFGFNTTTDSAYAGVSLASAPTRCSTDVPFWINLFNRSCNPAAGKVVVLPDSLLHFVGQLVK